MANTTTKTATATNAKATATTNSTKAPASAPKAQKPKKSLEDQLREIQLEDQAHIESGLLAHLDATKKHITAEHEASRKHTTAESVKTRTVVSAEHEATRDRIDELDEANEDRFERLRAAFGSPSLLTHATAIAVCVIVFIAAYMVIGDIFAERLARTTFDVEGNLIAEWDAAGKVIRSTMDQNDLDFTRMASFFGAMGSAAIATLTVYGFPQLRDEIMDK